MLEIIKSLPALALIAGYAFYGNLSPDKSLRPWSLTGANAYVQIVNNVQINLPVFVAAPAVDSAVRYLGIVPKCDNARFKLPYVDTKVTVIISDQRVDIDINKPGTYFVEVGAGGEYACRYTSKTVWRILDYASELQWKQSPYWRTEDQPNWPWRVYVAGDYTACPVFDTSEIDVPYIGEVYACKTGWRIARR